MSIRMLLSALFTMVITNYAAAQTIAIDMDTASGIQAATSSGDTAQLVTVQIRISGAINLFSYQYKVAFDTSRLSFVSAQLDAGPLGEKNILTRNGGVLIGVYQVQLNPPASDTLEISASITGADPAKSVSGDGLIGVAYFKFRTAFSDSTVISASSGFTAIYGGDFAPVPSYAAGKYRVTPSVAVVSPARFSAGSIDDGIATRTIAVTIGTSVAFYNIAPAATNGRNPLTFRLFTPNGKCIATYSALFSAATRRLSIPLSRIVSPLSAGIYVGSIESNGRITSQTIRIR